MTALERNKRNASKRMMRDAPPMLTAVCVYFESPNVPFFSRCYTPDWVDRLYRGIARHYSLPFRMVCLVDQLREFREPIEQQLLSQPFAWRDVLLQAYAVDADRIAFMGLDTVIVGNVDELFTYDGPLALPMDPYRQGKACSGLVLCPSRQDIAAAVAPNDMLALDSFPHEWLDDLYPGQVVSYKGHVQAHGLGDARIVYFHGEPKPHQLNEPWVKEQWLCQT